MNESNKPHIAIVVDSIVDGGGVNKIAKAQSKALCKHFHVSLLCAEGNLDSTNINLIRVEKPKLYWLRRFGHWLRALSFSFRTRAALFKLNKKQTVDFVLCHSHVDAWIIKRATKISLPVGVVVHGDIFSRPRGTYDPFLTLLYKIASRRTYKTADRIFVLSPSMEAKVLNYGAKTNSTHVIPNGIDKKDLPSKPIQRDYTSRPFKLLFVGRLSVEKDPSCLINAIALVDCDTTLTIVGEGPMREELQSHIDRAHLNDRIQLVGKLNSESLSTLYAESHALCIPSVDDPLPTVVLEAMSYCLPVIGTDCDGIPFMVADKKTGIIVPKGSTEAFSRAIKTLYQSPELCLAYGIAARDRIESDFELGSVSQRIAERIAETILNQK